MESENQNQNQENSEIKPQVHEDEKVVETSNRHRSSSLNNNPSADMFFRVLEPTTKDGIKKFTLYKVECSLIKDPVFKRYSDFDALRTKLCEKWPGIYVPNIPPKKMVGNLESSFIESRCLQLREFGVRLAELPFLFNSEEVKIFLQSEDVEKALGKIPKDSPEEILMRYKKSFINIVSDVKNVKIDEDVNKCTGFMTRVLVGTLSTLKVSDI